MIVLCSAVALLMSAPVFAAGTIVVSGVNEFGRHFTVRMFSDGKASGWCGDCVGDVPKHDSGHWWREGDTLCAKWQHWRRGNPRCDVHLSGGKWRYQQ
jgi:hypothetical protein